MADDASLQPVTTGHPHVRRAFLAVTAGLSALVMVASAVGLGGYFWTRSQIETIPDPDRRHRGDRRDGDAGRARDRGHL